MGSGCHRDSQGGRSPAAHTYVLRLSAWLRSSGCAISAKRFTRIYVCFCHSACTCTHSRTLSLYTVPDDMDGELLAFIESCWDDNPACRPSISVIIFSLTHLFDAAKERKGDEQHDVMLTRVHQFCRAIHSILWIIKDSTEAEYAAVASLLHPDVNVTAKDETLRKMLENERGLDCIKTLGWMMFGGIEDGAEIVPEPLLKEHIICNLDASQALITFHFAVKPPEKPQRWTVKDVNEYESLERVLAAEIDLSSLVWKTRTGKAGKSRHRKLEREQKGSAARAHRRKEKNKDFVNFIKAAKYVRGIGASNIHPSAKLRLYGLQMQAQRGDAREKDAKERHLEAKDASLATDSKEEEIKGSVFSLRKLKFDAWCAEAGKDRKAAMLEYIEMLTAIAPRWKVAHILSAHDSLKNRDPTQMVWVLKVAFEKRSTEEVYHVMSSKKGANAQQHRVVSRLSLSELGKHLLATSIEIVQWDGKANARLFCEQNTVPKLKGPTSHKDEGKAFKQENPFLANMPTDLTLDDCIIDKIKHKTIEDQRAYFSEKMRRMARRGFDDDDGWKLCGRTIHPSLADENQLAIYGRQVAWSSTEQLRSTYSTELPAGEIFDSLLKTFETESSYLEKDPKNEAVKEGLRNQSCPFLLITPMWATAINYREYHVPWPLSKRDHFIVQDYVKVVQDSGRTWFFTYNHSLEHAYFAPREGFVRVIIRNQGLVGIPITPKEAEHSGTGVQSRLTWLVNVSLGGIFPSSFVRIMTRDLMIIPYRIAQMASKDLKHCNRPSQINPRDGGDAGDQDPFITNIPTDLSIKNCLVDMGDRKFATISEQRKFFKERMQHVGLA